MLPGDTREDCGLGGGELLLCLAKHPLCMSTFPQCLLDVLTLWAGSGPAYSATYISTLAGLPLYTLLSLLLRKGALKCRPSIGDSFMIEIMYQKYLCL
jgi:hypothetical protein